MPRGGARPGSGPASDPNSERSKAKAAKLSKQMGAEKPAKKAKGHAPSGVKSADAPANWPFGVSLASAPPEADTAQLMPLEFMLSLVRDLGLDERTRLQAAIQAAPYCHSKKGEGGKKEQQQDAAKKVSKFSRTAAPKLVVNNRS